MAAVALLSVGAVGAGWGIAEYRLAQREAEVATAQAAYLELLADVSHYYDEFAAVAREFEANEQALLALLEGEKADAADLDAIEAHLAHSREVRAEGLAGSANLKSKLQLMATDLRSVVSRNDQMAQTIALLQDQLRAAEDDRRAIAQAREEMETHLASTEAALVEADARNAELDDAIEALEAELARSVAELEAELAGSIAALEAEHGATVDKLETELASERSKLETEQAAGAELRQQLASLSAELSGAAASSLASERRLQQAQSEIAQLRAERTALAQARERLTANVGRLQGRIAAMEASQQSVVEHLAARTRVGADEVEKTVAMTGVDVNTLLGKVSIGEASALSGLGGPFVPARERQRSGDVQTILASVAPLDLEMSRWEKLQIVLRTLPLSAPLDGYTVGSLFGQRKDPFNGKLASHFGLDFTAPLGSAVLATAPGKVVHAGRKGSYGRLVEIDHGFGIVTRYAHLKEITVEVGQAVGYRDQIGKLGSSGRSTGPHVHYEILVDGQPYDPMNFLKAGRYVFKG